MGDSDSPKVSICQAEAQHVYHLIQKRKDTVMNLRWESEEGLWVGQADFGRIVMLDSRSFTGVVLRETVVASTLCAFEIAIFIVFGIFAR